MFGFWDGIVRGWGFTKEAISLARNNRDLLKPSVYSVMAGLVYWVVWIGVFIATDTDFEAGEGKGLGAIATFGSFLIFYFFMGMTVNMIDEELKGGTPCVRDAFDDAKQNFVAIVFLAIISTAVELLANAARRSSRESESLGPALLLRAVASIIEAVWTVIAFLLLPAIIIEDLPFGDALRRVRQISKGNYLVIGIGHVGVRFVTGMIGFVVMIVLWMVIHVSFNVVGGTAGTVMGIGMGGTILCLYCAFASYLRMAYYTCLYIWAADVADNGPEVQAPLPLARVL